MKRKKFGRDGAPVEPGANPAPDAATIQALKRSGVDVQVQQVDQLMLKAVPVSESFSKPRTNLLLQKCSDHGCDLIYIDADLRYMGENPSIHDAFRSDQRRQNWLRLRVPTAQSRNREEVLFQVLHDYLESPIAHAVGNGGDVDRPECGHDPESKERTTGHELELARPQRTGSELETCFFPVLARKVANILTRFTGPSSVVLCGPSGSGKSHTLLAAANALASFEHGSRSVVTISGAELDATSQGDFDRDRRFVELLDAAPRNRIYLVEGLEHALGCRLSVATCLAERLEAGERVMASVSDPNFAWGMSQHAALRRRLVFLGMPTLHPKRLREVLQTRAAEHDVEIVAGALKTIARVARESGTAEPGTSLAILESAIAEVRAERQKVIHPDDVVAAWPMISGE